jgi:uncharacterized protein (DUF302 family)
MWTQTTKKERSMLRKLMSLTTALTLGLAATSAHAEMIAKTSLYSVAETMDRLEAAVTAAGATVFARIDHAAGAKKVELELRPTQLLIFGNPKLGTPAMTDNQTAGLDLPLRVLAYADGEGVVHVTYHAPATLAQTHALPAEAKYIQIMTGALDKLTGKAIAAE